MTKCDETGWIYRGSALSVGRCETINDLKLEESSGFSSDKYKLPKGATELQDCIEHKSMNFAVGNIFKAAYRMGETKSPAYDLEKIIWFAERELERLAPAGGKIVIPKDATEDNIPEIADRIVEKVNEKLEEQERQEEKAYYPFGIWRDKGEDKEEH